MKKILITFMCICMSFVMAGIPAMAEGEFKIISGTPADGEKNASISVLMKYEFSSDIKAVTADEITCLPASVGEVETQGSELIIRLALPKTYNTEYTLDLSAVESADGKKLSADDKIITFKTKDGAEGKILEDDFETKTVDTTKWRAPSKGSGVVQKEGDNGNWSYYVAGGAMIDNYVNPLPFPIGLENKAIIDFDLLIENATADYKFFTLLGNNGLSGDEAKSFESYWTGLLCYDCEDKTFGVLYNQEFYSGQSGSPKSAEAAVSAKEGWNKLRVVFDLEASTLKLFVNGEQALDGNGNGDFAIPYSSKYGSAGQKLINVRIPGSSSGATYFDNMCYRQLDPPVIASSSVKEGDTLSVTCPEIKMEFKNDITALSLKVNGEDVPEGDIVKNDDGTYSAFLSLVWGESYILEGKMYGLYGTESNFELNFSTIEQNGNLIESAGFYSEGKRVYAIKSGDITAKLKFWQEEEQGYLYAAAVYKNEGGRIEMITPLTFGEFTASENLAEKEICVTVPENAENCFIKVFVLYDSLTRVPYADSFVSGSLILE